MPVKDGWSDLEVDLMRRAHRAVDVTEHMLENVRTMLSVSFPVNLFPKFDMEAAELYGGSLKKTDLRTLAQNTHEIFFQPAVVAERSAALARLRSFSEIMNDPALIAKQMGAGILAISYQELAHRMRQDVTADIFGGIYDRVGSLTTKNIRENIHALSEEAILEGLPDMRGKALMPHMALYHFITRALGAYTADARACLEAVATQRPSDAIANRKAWLAITRKLSRNDKNRSTNLAPFTPGKDYFRTARRMRLNLKF